MIRKLALILLCIVLIIPFGACSHKENTENDGTPLFEFDTREMTKKLVSSFENNEPPLSVYVIYDQSGSLPSAESTDSEYIRSIYDALSKIKVLGESNESITDCYHCAAFTFADGTSSGFNFEGESLLCIDSKTIK